MEDEEPTRLSASDIAGAPEEWRRRAESGDAWSQFVFGYLNERGIGVPWSASAAAHWFELSAAQGEPHAAYELGLLRFAGVGVEQSFEIAATLFQQAADKGDPRAESALGDLYNRGTGVAMDTAKALALFKQAADQGDAAGQISLGTMIWLGRGTDRDPERAMALYRLAAGRGSAGAEVILGQALQSGRAGKVDYAGALTQFQLAADQHNPVAESFLAGLYRYGWGTTKDYSTAAKWYQAAADDGSVLSKFRLALMDQQGVGVPSDPEEARRLYELAAQGGINEAAVRVGDMFAAGQGVTVSLDRAAYWYRLAADRGSAAAEDRVVEMLGKKQVRAAKPGELANYKKMILALTTLRLANFEVLRQVSRLLIDQEGWPIGSSPEQGADDLTAYLLLETELAVSPAFSTDEMVHAVARASFWSKSPPARAVGVVPASAGPPFEADRAKRLICLAVGARPDTFSDDAALEGIDAAGVDECHQELVALKEEVAPIVPEMTLLLPGGPDNDVSVGYDRPSRRLSGAAQDFAVWRLPDNVAEFLRRGYPLPRGVKVKVQSCRKPVLSYDPKAVAIILCYEYADDLVQRVGSHLPQ